MDSKTLNERADERADYLSRIVDHDDWQLNPVVFADLDVAWGPIQLTVCEFSQLPGTEV